MEIYFTLNGEVVNTNVPPEKRLIDVLREDFSLLKTKGLCYKGQCGSCTVLMNDKPVPSCLIPAFSIKSSEIITAEEFIKTKVYKFLMKLFRSHALEPCDYCRWGKVYSIYSLLQEKKIFDKKELYDYFLGNQCNCTDMDAFLDLVIIALNKAREEKLDV